jgi:hypothetical protein
VQFEDFDEQAFAGDADALYALSLYRTELEEEVWLTSAITTPKVELCEVCQEPRPLVVHIACGHEYCAECLENTIRLALKEESLFPPRCCKEPIAVYALRHVLSVNLVKEFEQKRIEYSTVEKTYCSRRTCSAFIPTGAGSPDGVSCGKCGTLTCRHCKLRAHLGECPKDDALRKVLKVAATKRWQRCWMCRQLVEKDEGCSHMT